MTARAFLLAVAFLLVASTAATLKATKPANLQWSNTDWIDKTSPAAAMVEVVTGDDIVAGCATDGSGVTYWLVILDRTTGNITYASAASSCSSMVITNGLLIVAMQDYNYNGPCLQAFNTSNISAGILWTKYVTPALSLQPPYGGPMQLNVEQRSSDNGTRLYQVLGNCDIWIMTLLPDGKSSSETIRVNQSGVQCQAQKIAYQALSPNVAALTVGTLKGDFITILRRKGQPSLVSSGSCGHAGFFVSPLVPDAMSRTVVGILAPQTGANAGSICVWDIVLRKAKFFPSPTVHIWVSQSFGVQALFEIDTTTNSVSSVISLSVIRSPTLALKKVWATALPHPVPNVSPPLPLEWGAGKVLLGVGNIFYVADQAKGVVEQVYSVPKLQNIVIADPFKTDSNGSNGIVAYSVSSSPNGNAAIGSLILA